MNEYAITFRKLRSICKHRTSGVYGYIVKNSHACTKKLTMDWVKSEDPTKFIECRENNCPVLAKCDNIKT